MKMTSAMNGPTTAGPDASRLFWKPMAVEASACLQNDVRSLPAERICRLTETLSPTDKDAARGLALLQGWDHNFGAASAPAALFEVWWMLHLRPALLSILSGNPVLEPLLVPGDITTLVDVL